MKFNFLTIKLNKFILPQQHVQDGRKESFDGYVSTFSKPLPPDGNAGVFALDCEMVSEVFYLLKTFDVNAKLPLKCNF